MSVRHRGWHIFDEGKLQVAPGSSQQKIFVDPQGDDNHGTGMITSPVATITKAFTLVTATRRVVMLAPGEYAEAASLVWPTVNGVALIGAGNGVTSVSVPVATQTRVFTVTPGAQSTTYEGIIQGIEINHSGSEDNDETGEDSGISTEAQAGVVFSNASMGKKLLFSFLNCSFSACEIADKSINMSTHSDTGNAVRIYVRGDGSELCKVEGSTYYAVANNADRLQFENMWIEGSITTVGAEQLRLRLLRCIIPENTVRVTVIANSALQTVTVIDCKEWTDFADTVAEIYTFPTTACVTGTTAVIVANS